MSTDPQTDSRINVSLSTLRAELGSLELRLVDRLNAALSSKADRSVQDQLTQQMGDVATRLTALEKDVIKRDGPVVQAVLANTQEINSLKTIAGYRKWLVAQTVGLIGLSIPVIVFAADKLTQ